MGSKKRKVKRKEKPATLREEQRRRSYSLLKQGVKKADIARRLGLTWKTIWRWEKRAKREGWDSWRDKKHTGRPPRLQKDELTTLKGILLKKASARGYPTDLWTLKRVAEVIKQEFGYDYSITQAWRVLRNLGFSPQVPQVIALERNDPEVRKWIRNEWPKILDLARSTGATIVFLDESCVQSRPNVRKSWAPKGSPPVMRVVEGSRDKLSLISAVTIEGELYFNLHEEDITEAEVITFLDHLMKEMPGKIVVLWDSGGIHRSRAVKAFIWQNRRRLITRRFPVYSPQLNPDEMVWNLAKEKDLANWCPLNLEEMKRVVHAEMKKLRRQRPRVRSAIRHAKIPLPENGRLPRNWRRRVAL